MNEQTVGLEATEILKKWLQYTEYDPDQKSFNLLSNQYTLHKCCKTIEALQPYDPTGAFSVLYAKQQFIQMLKEISVKAFDCVQNPDYLAEEREMWAVFHSADVLAVEKQILDAFDAMVQKIVPAKMLGSRDKEKEREAINWAIEAIAEELPKCNEDLFLKGSILQPVRNFSTYIHVFNRLADCLLALEAAQDGIYLCYIRCDDTAEGYFGFYIKNNGNLLSVNERVNERYPGAHGNSRNGRWTENKKYSLFPYNFMFSFSDFDYKGYSGNHVIQAEEKTAFFNLEPKAYMPLILAMLMLNAKYAGTSAENMRMKFVDSLLPATLQLAEPGSVDLMVLQGSALAQRHQQLVLPLTKESFLEPDYADRFAWKKDGDEFPYDEYGSFRKSTWKKKPGQKDVDVFYDPYHDVPLFVALYGQDFQVDVSSLLASDIYRPQLPDAQMGENGTKKQRPVVEFVATERKLELVAYKAGRELLAEHIRDNMLKEYLSVGGTPGIEKWYAEQLHLQEKRIRSLCVAAYKDFVNGVNRECDDHLDVDCYEGKDDPETKKAHGRYHWGRYFNEKMYTPAGCWNGDLKCPITGAKASFYFTFDVKDYFGIARLLGLEGTPEALPKILLGYRYRGHHGYGNSILDVTDKVAEVGTPFEEHEARWNRRLQQKKALETWRINTETGTCEHVPAPETALDYKAEFDFGFIVGFSKRGMKKLLAEEEATGGAVAETGEENGKQEV